MKKAVAFLTAVLLLLNCLYVPGSSAQFKPTSEDEKFLDLVQKKAFDFFWENADPISGLIKDQTNNFKADGPKEEHKKYRASIASVGFGLSAYIVGVERGWITKDQAYKRVKATLETFDKKLFRDNRGLYYHWIDTRNNGQWKWKDGGSEISTIDTALFLTGAIAVAEYFNAKYDQPEFKEIVNRIYRNIKWNGLGDQLMSYYNEYIIITLLGMGSPENTISPSIWEKMWRNYQYSTANRKGESKFPRVFYPSLFIHIFPEVWFDFRDKHDQFADYFISARNSALANRQYCIDHAIGGIADKKYQFSTYGENSWGLSASEVPPPKNYDHYGEAEPALDDTPESGMRGLAGTVAIHAAGGTMPYIPEESLKMMKYLYANYKSDLWGKYGFCDSFNTDPRFKSVFNNAKKTMWRAEIVSGLDQGAILLMIENYRTGLIWKYFMMNEYVKKGMERAGFVDKPKPAEGASLDLSGKWCFKTGDDVKWAGQSFDDTAWQKIDVPSNWEDKGFAGYDGIAWYRHNFSVSDALMNSKVALVLQFGAVDDADETYLNGEKIGRLGQFPPGDKTAWDKTRVYEIPKSLLRKSGNTLAVRISDTGGGGGVWKGPVRIAPFETIQYNPLRVEISKEWTQLINLEGQWQFQTGEVEINALPADGWKQINVPGGWEQQGFDNYDGLAAYKKDFRLDKALENELKGDNATLKLGMIDDADVAYLNGTRIGKMGDFPPGKESAWDRPRTYEFPKKLLRFGESNTIVVIVNDNMGGGGIHKGPVEIVY